ncbi:methionine biosynthesis PLP-dependent protein [Actinobacillus pleuropneumoniae]|uniref:methionine biosynthesis PLP-dependent protein n=1 Tax=Actinobacillus pleuropneumoniae TaxID=715 RepID=UPI0002F7BB7E|nr:methionine biosynthesis PLP-dependent protein [Actinobacillus pleuropneumoniae]UKH16214.1 methionine biosynthesis PLP-dependent protein [Actinobacillus pleuropneumoniae]UKH19763.1 methionine biosynthesis PLP-dependent protein [Actinobacillus pleuropneumoniae]UKH28425.1 methionine biosynthesis PLP-dependent protein [Actinobacillus pleuropneumoniae]UKH40940.1 methionine biosynthesis PLP-dependent protein [Actinobacillus pleuropneumoniae serovar 4 str. M62]UPA21579.1 methionine biosynthesis PL
MTKYSNIETTLVQLGNRTDPRTGAVATPIVLSTAYGRGGLGESTGWDYIRTKNPTRAVLEQGIADLEGGDAGFAMASGMAAIQLVMSLFKAPDEWIISSDVYGGSYRLFDFSHKHHNTVKPVYVNTADLAAIEAAITPNTKAIFVETPSNPLMEECDVDAISKIAKKHNLMLIVDNTFLTPILFRPIEHGADIVIHSATKYLSGHNDVLAGLIVAKDSEATKNEAGQKLSERLFYFQNCAGAVLSPFDSYLAVRGLKTLALRMERHQSNATELARFLSEQPEIESVLYSGKSGMLSFRLQKEEWVPKFLKAIKLITFAESLGGTESFITYPSTQTHMDIPEAERIARGITNNLLRFSVGLEHVEDLKADLRQAFGQLK